jgi:hypothetical protein
MVSGAPTQVGTPLPSTDLLREKARVVLAQIVNVNDHVDQVIAKATVDVLSDTVDALVSRLKPSPKQRQTPLRLLSIEAQHNVVLSEVEHARTSRFFVGECHASRAKHKA